MGHYEEEKNKNNVKSFQEALGLIGLELVFALMK